MGILMEPQNVTQIAQEMYLDGHVQEEVLLLPQIVSHLLFAEMEFYQELKLVTMESQLKTTSNVSMTVQVQN